MTTKLQIHTQGGENELLPEARRESLGEVNHVTTVGRLAAERAARVEARAHERAAAHRANEFRRQGEEARLAAAALTNPASAGAELPEPPQWSGRTGTIAFGAIAFGLAAASFGLDSLRIASITGLGLVLAFSVDQASRHAKPIYPLRRGFLNLALWLPVMVLLAGMVAAIACAAWVLPGAGFIPPIMLAVLHLAIGTTIVARNCVLTLELHALARDRRTRAEHLARGEALDELRVQLPEREEVPTEQQGPKRSRRLPGKEKSSPNRATP